ncbi:MAG TPA: fasciclin domain-containing protein [Coleofasciculaceae cyanobacterium]
MKIQTRLLISIIGLSALFGLPALAGDKPMEGMPTSTEQRVSPSSNQSSEDSKTPSSAMDAESTSKNLVEQAASNDQFKTLTAAIEAAGLKEALSAEGPYTVFAPTDEAFAALPEGVLDQLLKPENRDTLVQLLKYHVVSGAVTSDKIQSGDVETLAGEPLAVQLGPDGTVTVNNAKVTQADLQASNGVIHVVDNVILPQQVQAQLQTAPKPAN